MRKILVMFNFYVRDNFGEIFENKTSRLYSELSDSRKNINKRSESEEYSQTDFLCFSNKKDIAMLPKNWSNMKFS